MHLSQNVIRAAQSLQKAVDDLGSPEIQQQVAIAGQTINDAIYKGSNLLKVVLEKQHSRE